MPRKRQRKEDFQSEDKLKAVKEFERRQRISDSLAGSVKKPVTLPKFSWDKKDETDLPK